MLFIYQVSLQFAVTINSMLHEVYIITSSYGYKFV